MPRQPISYEAPRFTAHRYSWGDNSIGIPRNRVVADRKTMSCGRWFMPWKLINHGMKLVANKASSVSIHDLSITEGHEDIRHAWQ